MTDFSTLSTLLLAQWDTGVIAKPTIRNHTEKGQLMKHKHLYITVGRDVSIKSGAIDGSLEMRETFFKVQIFAASRSDLDKYSGEVRRILLQNPPSGGFYRIRQVKFFQKPSVKNIRCDLIGSEKIMIAVTEGT